MSLVRDTARIGGPAAHGLTHSGTTSFGTSQAVGG